MGESYLVVGLGNPGSKYTWTRHNIGFLIVDAFARAQGQDFQIQKRFQSQSCELENFFGKHLILLKPQTYMNLSGEAVQSYMAFLKLPPERLVLIHDELDLPFAALKASFDSGAAGHRGVKSVIQHLGHKHFARIRVGIGRPVHPQQDVVSYVLSQFTAQEREQIPTVAERVEQALEYFLTKGVDEMIQYVNSMRRK